MLDPTPRPSTQPLAPPPLPAAPEPPSLPTEGTLAPADAPAPPTAPEPTPGKPFSWKDDFGGLDKNSDGKLAKSELKLPGAKGSDLNKDGQVDYREFRSARVKANSFEGLDADKSGTLDAGELAKLQRFDNRQYGDGQTVTKEQFNETRAAELRDNRQARRLERFEAGLDKAEAKKMERFAGEDGKLSADEYVAGKKQLWREWHGKRQDKLFARAGGKDGVLDVTTKEGARYKAYDADQDGKVSKAEFKEGYKADLREVWQARRESGKLTDKGLRERLAFGRDSFANKIEMPTSAGDLHASRNDWFISQYGTKFNPNEDVPGWDNANCGPTSLTMVARAFGKIDIEAGGADAAIEKSRRLMGDSQSETSGTSGEGIARGAEAYGLDAKIVDNIDLKGIEAELAKGRLPVVNGNVIRPDGSYGGGHFYVVTKIQDGKAYLNDPYSKTGPTVVSTDRLMHSINSHWSHRIISIGDK